MPQQREGFVAPDDPILDKIATEIPVVEITSPDIQSDIEFMLDKAYGQQKDRKKAVLVGLAAPQVGISNGLFS
jgi:peptide deformylase